MAEITQTIIVDRAGFLAATEGWSKSLGTGFALLTNGLSLKDIGSRIVGFSLAGWVTESGHDGGKEEPTIAVIRIPIADVEPVLLDLLLTFLPLPIICYDTPQVAAWVWKKWGIRMNVRADAYVANRLLHRLEEGLHSCVTAYLEASSPEIDEAALALLLASEAGKKVSAAQLDGVYQVELRTCVEMACQGANGYVVDPEIVDQERRRAQAELAELESSIFNRLGAFSINSNAQLGKRLATLGIESPAKTASGEPSWSKEVLASLTERHPVIADISAWKTTSWTLSALSSQSSLAAVATGRAYPTWHPMGLRGSARFVCEAPPLPTLPQAFRRAFVAPPGQRWVRLTWRQPELRMLAVLSQCRPLAAFLADPADPFERWAARMGSDRDTVKTAVYGYIKGRMLIEPDPILVGLVHDLFHEDYGQAIAYTARAAAEGAHTGFVRGWLNRRFECTALTPKERCAQAIDAVLGGSVATALKVAMGKILNLRDLVEQSGTATALAFKGFGQLIPVVDTLFYVIDEDVPLGGHLATFAHQFQLNLLADVGGEFYLPIDVGVGRSWGTIETIDPRSLWERPVDE